ncbi:ankyrin repeat domain-containing protein [Endozoicomonas sp.]|uniref:ankyrin repeat domain-containing protein n=1 Tax=Endozoicomonas sp. TaxID=1892382 RepID=UPI002884C051|nr:ankyrin repeat domain-containing protein [Endozoicomonas sp.]
MSADDKVRPIVRSSCPDKAHYFHQACIKQSLKIKPLSERRCCLCRSADVVPLFDPDEKLFPVGLPMTWPEDLLKAITTKNDNDLKSLLKNGADPDLKDYYGIPPEVCKIDLRNMNPTYNDANTGTIQPFVPFPLMISLLVDNLSATKILIDYHADVTLSVFDYSLPKLCIKKDLSDHLNVLLLRLQSGVNTTINQQGTTLLHLSAEFGSIHCGRLLVQSGAKTDTYDKKGQLPFCVNASFGKLAFGQMLLKHGLSINTRNARGCSLLHCAADNCQNKYLRWLLDIEGINKGVLCHEGSGIMHSAARGGNRETIQLLSEAGFDINALTTAGYTPLHRASALGRLEAVRALVDYGAKTDAKFNGDTAADLAVKNRHTDVVNFLQNPQ